MERYALRKFDVKNNFVMACGGGTPCFHENLQWMKTEGIVIYLQSTASDILERIMNETHERPLLSKVNPSELLFFIQQKLKEREPFYTQAQYILEVNTLTANSLNEIIESNKV
jgi:shikimate kinase